MGQHKLTDIRVLCAARHSRGPQLDRSLYTPSLILMTLTWVPQVRELGFTRTPFAIKCSGHTGNPGFSSTPGVQISMSRFRDIVLNEEEGTVEIGAGLTWTDVYSYLVPKGLNVVGGRVDGVGVSGFILGGGRHILPA